jgi:hypothetical protein
MVAPAATLDKREPRGIIIRAGTPRRAGAPFWAYVWSEEIGPGACAEARGGRILETAHPPELSSPECRASP